MGNDYCLTTVRGMSDGGKSIISDLIYYPPYVEVSSPDLSVNFNIHKPKIPNDFAYFVVFRVSSH